VKGPAGEGTSIPGTGSAPREERGRVSALATVLIFVLVLGLGAAVTFLIFHFEPTAGRTESTRETAKLVEVRAGSAARSVP